MTFGAPSHRIEPQLSAAARILEVTAEFVHLPGLIICAFGDEEFGTTDTQFVKARTRLALGALHKVHITYRQVVHDEISAKEASENLNRLLASPPLYGTWIRCGISFIMSALICALAFGGSFMDMWFAGLGALALSSLQLTVVSKGTLLTNVFE
jgi:uncharacterized membrane protein YjjP (DUF1212 family)